MSGNRLHVLVLCTGNSARSILAEALLNRADEGRVRAFSAGSHPKASPHPLALELLRTRGHDTARLRSKSWSEFAGEGAPRVDIVITVCDAAAGESCPLWPGTPIKAHWGIDDPAAVEGDEETRRRAFSTAYERLAARVDALLALPLESMDAAAITQALRRIGTLERAT
jgi:protein-tyrosine-phosphatase